MKLSKPYRLTPTLKHNHPRKRSAWATKSTRNWWKDKIKWELNTPIVQLFEIILIFEILRLGQFHSKWIEKRIFAVPSTMDRPLPSHVHLKNVNTFTTWINTLLRNRKTLGKCVMYTLQKDFVQEVWLVASLKIILMRIEITSRRIGMMRPNQMIPWITWHQVWNMHCLIWVRKKIRRFHFHCYRNSNVIAKEVL